jgi:hypothetical protein
MICSTEGDLGDGCYLLGILREIPGEHTLLLSRSSKTKIRTDQDLRTFHALFGPLAESQPYITECRPMRVGDKVDWASANFRSQGHYSMGESLLEAHRKNLESTLGVGSGISGSKKWLEAKPSPLSRNRVLINRTGRYRNDRMPWSKIVGHYSHRLAFVGLKHEWREFCSMFGYVDFLPTANLLEVAELIAGCAGVFANQSSFFAIAEGLKFTPRTLEVSLQFPDTVFGGAQYVVDGACHLVDVNGSGTLDIPSDAFKISAVQTMYQPTGGWRFEQDGLPPIIESTHEKAAYQLRRRNRDKGLSVEESERLVIEQNVRRVPRFFARYMQMPDFSRARAALQAAGVTDHPLHEIAKGNIQFTT